MIDKDFWRNKKVFLTGHTGFKGSWLSLWLEKMGAVVHGYALEAPTSPALFHEARVDETVESTIADVRNFQCLQETMQRFAPDIVFHMAAQPLVRYSYANPLETYEVNVMGTANLLEAVRSVPSVRAVVVVTSDKCYENREWVWGYRENEPMGGYDPYSNSKGCAELVTGAFRQSFFNNEQHDTHRCAIATCRAGNVIGGGDWAEDRLVPDTLKAFEQGEAVSIRRPGAIRPWQHVLEPLSGYLLCAQQLYQHGPAYAEAWNFGPEDTDARTVEWIVDRLSSVWGDGASWSVTDDSPHHEAHYLKLDISKARAGLGWRPRWPLEHTLDKIVRWHKAWLSGSDMKAFTLAEIDEFEAAG